MRRTCIICGGPTGSREHVFPAALGGRRTNKGIYCGTHNGAYSGLAGIIAGQLRLFNALLGVVGDHATETTPADATDMASGRPIALTNTTMRFTEPQILSRQVSGATETVEMTFATHEEAQAWIREQEAGGATVTVARRAATRYQVGTAHAEIKLGGTREGLRAIAYIAQTFFAQAFPDVARDAALQGIKDYTLHGIGSDFVCWDFEPPRDLPPNRFAFGHRVVVGLDRDSGTAYARIAFFSTLEFAILFGPVAVPESRSVITDIDPLARAAPNDIVTWSEPAARSTVRKSADSGSSLADAIASGRAEQLIGDLMRRIEDDERHEAAGSLLGKIAATAALASGERHQRIAAIVEAEAQRVFRLMRLVGEEFRENARQPLEIHLADLFDAAVALDPAAANGLSAQATASLALASDALARQIAEEFEANILDQDRLAMLIGGGPGAATVGQAIFAPIVERFPDR